MFITNELGNRAITHDLTNNESFKFLNNFELLMTIYTLSNDSS